MSFSIKIDPRMITEVAQAIEAHAEKVEQACRAGVYQLASQIVEESESLVPRDEGTLARSRTVD